MDRDACISTVYCLVCEQYSVIEARDPLRRGGFAPLLPDEEVITMEICGEYCNCSTDQASFDYLRAHYRSGVPQLTDRTRFVRQAAHRWQVKAALPQRLTLVRGQADDPVPVLATLPVPVCGSTRAPRDRCFNPEADYGACAAHALPDYGCKLGLRSARSGMITAGPRLPARPHAIKLLHELVAGCHGLAPADKGCIAASRQAHLAERQGVLVLTPPRHRMSSRQPRRLLNACRRMRKRIAPVGSQLTDRFAIARMRVRDRWHFQHRIIRKVLAHTVVVFLNVQLGRPPLDLDDLVVV